MKLDLSIIIPCYNETEKLPKSLTKVATYMAHNFPQKNYEIIVVNDGSTKTTDSEFKTYGKESFANGKNKEYPNLKGLRLISYSLNRGKGYAVKRGISESTGKTVLFMDCDLSVDLKAIEDVFKYRETFGYDVIIGSRRNQRSVMVKEQTFVRKIVSFCCNKLTNIIIPLHIKDTQCGFKAFEGNFARQMVKKQISNRFAFDVEYLYISKLNHKGIQEIPVSWENDEDSKVSVVDASIEFFECLFKIRNNRKSYIKLEE